MNLLKFLYSLRKAFYLKFSLNSILHLGMKNDTDQIDRNILLNIFQFAYHE